MKKHILFITLFLCLFAPLSAKIKATKITGTIKNTEAKALKGVLIRNTTIGISAMSDANGSFAIEAKKGDTLLFTLEGYIQVTTVVSQLTQLSVVLNRPNTPLSFIDPLEDPDDALVDPEILEDASSVSLKRPFSPPHHLYTRGKLKLSVRDIPYRSCYTPPRKKKNSYAHFKENSFLNPKNEPLSTFSIDVDNASYSSIRTYLQRGNKPPKDAVRIEEMINYFSYDFKASKGKHPFGIHTELAACPWNENHQLLQVALQAKKIDVKHAPASNLVFLIDVSGSMNAPNKLPVLKKAFGLLVKQLRAKDKVAIVVYAGSSGIVLASTSGAEKAKIQAAIERLHASGGTAGAQGLELAYKVAEENYIEGGNNRIILATDGDFNIGKSSDSEMESLIEDQRKKGIFISVTGYGMGNYKDSKMEIIADKGNGNYYYIDTVLEAKKVFVTEFGGTLYSLAKDVKIQVEFNPNVVRKYRLIGYENRLLAADDFQNDHKDAGEIGAGHSVVAFYEIVPTSSQEQDDTDLKYQNVKNSITKRYDDELATVKFRYKKPKEATSKLLKETIKNEAIPFKKASKNFQFASTVAGFGMLLRNSEYRGTMTYASLLELAKDSKGKDVFGYRSEYIQLLSLAAALD
ncbi:MAG: YfbK domain-containing protein [Flavicella sp.]